MNQARQIISIPFKIKRSPTDLLKALSKTVDIDPNGPLYYLLDDTALTPINQIDKKRNLLSKASGIRAAQLMIEKYPQAFMKDDCVPRVSKFFPPKFFTEEELKYPSEDLILSLISWGKFREAFNSYLKCKDQNIEVSETCKLSLLDVLSLYNCNDYEKEAPPMESWFTKNTVKKSRLSGEEEAAAFEEAKLKLWKKNGEAEIMFKELKEKSAQAYCSLIKGMAKHSDPNGAYELYKEMKQNNLSPDLNTMNELILLIGSDGNSSDDQKIKHIMEKLHEIKALGIMPNLRTFNSCLKVVSAFNIHQENINFTLNILKEMETLNIQPSLATWSYVLNVFYPKQNFGSKTEIFAQVLNEVENMSKSGLEFRDLNDPNFFTVAVEKCQFRDNAKYIHRVHSILMKNNNIKFLNNEVIYNNYFENYLTVLIQNETSDVIIKEWRAITPHIMSRTTRMLKKMFEFASNNKCFDFVPELWSNFIESKQRRNRRFSSEILKLLIAVMTEYKEKNELSSQYGSIIEMISKNFSYMNEKKASIQLEKDESEQQDLPFEFDWEGKMLENFFNIALHTEKLKLAWDEFEKYSNNTDKVHGEISEKCISNLFNAFLAVDDITKAIKILNFAVSQRMMSILTNELFEKLKQKNLDNEQTSFLDSLNSKRVSK